MFGSRFQPLWSTLGVALLLSLSTLSRPAAAFTYIAQPMDTLAALAERFYGKIQNERLLVAANALDVQGGVRIVAGMRLEIPAVNYVRISRGETWKDLAAKYLGGEHRAFALADANGSKPWLPPNADAEIIVPYNLKVVATGNESIVGIAYRYLGDRKTAWMLDNYNQRKGRRLQRGEVVLVPLVDIELTESGKQAARWADALLQQQVAGAARDAQLRAEREIPRLASLIQSGRYLEAVNHGIELSSGPPLARPQRARVARAMLEAYVALGAEGRAKQACADWLEADPNAKLDPVQLSPKILVVCTPQGRQGEGPVPNPSAVDPDTAGKGTGAAAPSKNPSAGARKR